MRTQLSRGSLASLLVVVVTWGCAPPGTSPTGFSSPSPTQASSTPAPPVGPLGAAGCRPVSPPGAFAGEVYATATGGTVWAWFMAAYPPRAGIEDKTVWRLNGPGASGAPTFVLVGPAGQRGRLNWGPDVHFGSSWNRPGAEFGTGLFFPAKGCWDVRVAVGQVSGDVYVLVT